MDDAARLDVARWVLRRAPRAGSLTPCLCMMIAIVVIAALRGVTMAEAARPESLRALTSTAFQAVPPQRDAWPLWRDAGARLLALDPPGIITPLDTIAQLDVALLRSPDGGLRVQAIREQDIADSILEVSRCDGANWPSEQRGDLEVHHPHERAVQRSLSALRLRALVAGNDGDWRLAADCVAAMHAAIDQMRSTRDGLGGLIVARVINKWCATVRDLSSMSGVPLTLVSGWRTILDEDRTKLFPDVVRAAAAGELLRLQARADRYASGIALPSENRQRRHFDLQETFLAIDLPPEVRWYAIVYPVDRQVLNQFSTIDVGALVADRKAVPAAAWPLHGRIQFICFMANACRNTFRSLTDPKRGTHARVASLALHARTWRLSQGRWPTLGELRHLAGTDAIDPYGLVPGATMIVEVAEGDELLIRSVGTDATDDRSQADGRRNDIVVRMVR